MLNLIRSELYKMGKSKVIMVITLCYAFLACIEVATMFFMSHNVEMQENIASMISITGNKGLCGLDGITVPLNGDLSYIMISIFVTLIMGHDFTSRSIYQIIGKGISRSKYVMAKFTAMICINVVQLAIYSLLCFLGYSMLFGVGGFNVQAANLLVVYFIGALSMIIGYTAIMEVICVLFKKINITMPICILFVFIGGMASQIILYITQEDTLSKYWLTNMSSSFSQT